MPLQVALPERVKAASPAETQERIVAAKEALGKRLVILGHHYQRDEVIRHADFTGDSFKLAQAAAQQAGGRLHRLLRRPLHGRVGGHPRRATTRW